MRALVYSAAIALACSACVGTTGSDLVSFDAFAAGPADAVKGQDYAFVSDRGFAVTLHHARIHVGAVYLNRARPISGQQATSCILPGIYVAEVTEGLDVDILSPDLQPFPRQGEATADHAVVGEVWLTHGDVNAPDDTDFILDIDGEAAKDGATYPFEGTLTIGKNRAEPVTDPSMPSQHPICKERIVSPIDVDITPRNGGKLILRVDPRGLFTDVDFSALTQISTSAPLYRGLQATSGVYAFSFIDSTEP